MFVGGVRLATINPIGFVVQKGISYLSSFFDRQRQIMRLLNSKELEASAVVANCAMNRERQLTGPNSYDRDLGFNILSFLQDRSFPVSWVDLCCGTGRALIQATMELQKHRDIQDFQIEGIDLTGYFAPNPLPELLTFREQGLEDWEPTGSYTLVTCVHGLHYVGDKLGAIAKAVARLRPDGVFLANLDLANFRDVDGRSARRIILSRFQENGLSYDSRRHLLECQGPRAVDFGLGYLGADDAIGPNYTGQSAVDSYYII
jgi:SAM-dependent methyltransferase